MRYFFDWLKNQLSIYSKFISHFETLRVAEIMEYISSHNINHFLVIDDAYLLIEMLASEEGHGYCSESR